MRCHLQMERRLQPQQQQHLWAPKYYALNAHASFWYQRALKRLIYAFFTFFSLLPHTFASLFCLTLLLLPLCITALVQMFSILKSSLTRLQEFRTCDEVIKWTRTKNTFKVNALIPSIVPNFISSVSFRSTKPAFWHSEIQYIEINPACNPGQCVKSFVSGQITFFCCWWLTARRKLFPKRKPPSTILKLFVSLLLSAQLWNTV